MDIIIILIILGIIFALWLLDIIFSAAFIYIFLKLFLITMVIVYPVLWLLNHLMPKIHRQPFLDGWNDLLYSGGVIIIFIDIVWLLIIMFTGK